MEEIKIDKRFEWIDDLEIDNLKEVLKDIVVENDGLKRAIVTGHSKSSIEIVRNTKGINVNVKVYDDDPDEASEKAIELFDKLSNKYRSED